MRIPRIYTYQPLQECSRLLLDPAPSRHLVQVLRLKPDARLRLFNGDGRDYAAKIESANKTAVWVIVGTAGAEEPTAPLDIGLLLAISKGERMDYALQKAVELGVQRIQPLLTEHTVVRLEGARLKRRMEHWRQVIIGASEQSGRNRIPRLDSVCQLEPRILQKQAGLRLLLAPDAELGLGGLQPPGRTVNLLTGPEGGLSAPEFALASSCGFLPIRLGPRILRTETAPLAAIAALQTLWGDFCQPGEKMV